VRPSTQENLPEPALTTIRGAQQMLGGVCRSTVYELIDAGEIQTVRILGRTLPKIASIQALIERGGTAPSGRSRPRKSGSQLDASP
jgi:hypothetical protein